MVDVRELLEVELLEDIENPAHCLLPFSEFPPGIVHADPHQWFRIVQTRSGLGLFAVVPKSSRLRGRSAAFVVNVAIVVGEVKTPPCG